MLDNISKITKSLVIISLLFTCLALQAAVPRAPSLTAKSYVLMDYDSGKIIAQSNPDLPVGPASLTKMMTGYVVSHELEAGNISRDDIVKISMNAYAQNPVFEGSSLMWLEVGKTVKLGELIKGLIISSGNDAAVALAEHVAGSESAFTDLMNHHAKKLGMNDTFFENAHGLSATQQKTTARDMAILGMALIRDFPHEYELYKQRSYTYNNIQTYNRHPLLADPSLNVDGIKTGHTKKAGYCLVSSATKDSMRLISVVMGTDSKQTRKVESKKLLSYGFRFFETVRPLEAGKVLHKPRIWMGESDEVELGIAEDIFVTIPRNSDLKAQYVVEKDLSAPIKKGQIAGKVFFMIGKETVAEHPLVALHDVEEAGFFGRMSDSVSQWFDSLFE
ncbi:D-alanyl-D-alanine carboxypeptidase [Aliikangiella marina]|uniref:serine-type D-Ala-D-Ala carboxypeptidase n=1 Tax=Aliikangiella marina TaxID=1712262 RepID=A0A545T9U4_9GAMM|nr:D-alanyl-D-alanine carboxypeptidase family protein [Aliikangiella marina]TQV73977.1 D-alanyl-D-alanine carboxypeptidase [Aliikangiella marina]